MIEAMSKGDAQLWGIMHDKFELLRRGGQPRAAIRIGETLVALSRRAFGMRDPRVAHTLLNVAALEIERALLEPAEEHLREAMAILEHAQPLDAVFLSHAVAQLGMLLSTRGETASALAMYVRAIDLTAEYAGPESDGLAVLLNNAALLFQATGDLAEAETRFRWAGAIYEKLHGGKDAQTATVLHNLGNLLLQREHYAEARAAMEKAAEIRAEILGRDDPALAQTLAALAVAHHGLGELDDARKLYERTMRIFQKHLPALANDFRTTAENLTSLLRSVGQTKQADSLQTQIRKQVAAA